ncbi:transporter substrate-binding domain-containing protein [Adlercreutzia sp. R25]|uniref:Transporter substrate-binding domain-containing protein n=1 Tax=Adlercreutzia shanghongiae TaxID=3111773 RepID=A0ABU6IXZ2_9ACTN|nr:MULTISPECIES: transporter substrate-binding domain-containing protein [unclassified Adlercreutzia]MEC4272558.1 transporter substrate-binding domain-containing protein [Adlercreutzia sp. R25]MEC4294541.1 transporter substrate-binding domain-containing protein [Adlercreutzia sp. R22]
MRKRSILATVLVALLAAATLGLAGCSGSGAYQPELKSAEVAPPVIGEEGTLRVGVNTENPPLAGMGSGKIIGIDVDIAAAVADELGLKLSIVDVGSDPAAAIANGDVDIVMGIDDSSSEGDFWRSASYLPTGIAVFALSPDAGIPAADSGATFAAQVSSKSAWAVSNVFGENSLTPTDSLKEAFEALQAGSVQYVAADAVIGLYAAHGQGLDASIVAMLMTPNGYCMGASNENVDLQTAAGDVLARLVGDGTIGVIERKWLGTTVVLDGLTVVSDQAVSAVGTEDGGADDASGEDEDSSDDATDTDASGDETGDDASGDEGDTSSEDTSGDEESAE